MYHHIHFMWCLGLGLGILHVRKDLAHRAPFPASLSLLTWSSGWLRGLHQKPRRGLLCIASFGTLPAVPGCLPRERPLEADASDQSAPLGWRIRRAAENPGLWGVTKLLDTGTQRLAEGAGLWSK